MLPHTGMFFQVNQIATNVFWKLLSYELLIPILY